MGHTGKECDLFMATLPAGLDRKELVLVLLQQSLSMYMHSSSSQKLPEHFDMFETTFTENVCRKADQMAIKNFFQIFPKFMLNKSVIDPHSNSLGALSAEMG